MSRRNAFQAVASWLPDGALAATAAAARRASPAYWHDVRRWQTFIACSERWSPEQLAAYQVERLRELVGHAAAHVPYYREVFAEHSFEPGDLTSGDDLRGLPLLEKRVVQERTEELVARNVAPAKRFYFTTAGSSGTPVGFWHDLEQPTRERAFMSAQWARVRYRDGARSAVLRGAVVEGGLWQKDVVNGTLLMSSYHLTEDRIPSYLSRLRKLRPRYLQAYPSTASILARFMLDHDEPPLAGLQAVLCGSENLYPWQRKLIGDAFACRVYSWYGQSEAVSLAGECEHDSTLHLFPQYGYTELLADDGSAVTEPGQSGEIVATGLHARAMPLLRYRTGDVAVLGAERCVLCRRQYALLERIEGRLQEFVVTGTGRRISMTSLNMHSPVFDNVFQFRFAQERVGEVSLRIVPKSSYSIDTDGPRIAKELIEKLGNDVVLQLELVDDIPRGGRGKYRFLDQMLSLEH